MVEVDDRDDELGVVIVLGRREGDLLRWMSSTDREQAIVVISMTVFLVCLFVSLFRLFILMCCIYLERLAMRRRAHDTLLGLLSE